MNPQTTAIAIDSTPVGVDRLLYPFTAAGPDLTMKGQVLVHSYGAGKAAIHVVMNCGDIATVNGIIFEGLLAFPVLNDGAPTKEPDVKLLGEDGEPAWCGTNHPKEQRAVIEVASKIAALHATPQRLAYAAYLAAQNAVVEAQRGLDAATHKLRDAEAASAAAFAAWDATL